MTKQSLAEQLIVSLDAAEWDFISNFPESIPVSAYNRKILLNLRDSEEKFSGNVDEKQVADLSKALYEYLADVWSEKLNAHKYVVCACLALAFLYELPMHPQEIVKYTVLQNDGKKVYHCPAKQDSIICNFCVAEKMQEYKSGQ